MKFRMKNVCGKFKVKKAKNKGAVSKIAGSGRDLSMLPLSLNGFEISQPTTYFKLEVTYCCDHDVLKCADEIIVIFFLLGFLGPSRKVGQLDAGVTLQNFAWQPHDAELLLWIRPVDGKRVISNSNFQSSSSCTSYYTFHISNTLDSQTFANNCFRKTSKKTQTMPFLCLQLYSFVKRKQEVPPQQALLRAADLFCIRAVLFQKPVAGLRCQNSFPEALFAVTFLHFFRTD